MYDGIAIETEINDFPAWRSRMPFEIHTPINTDTGQIKARERADNSINGKFLQFSYQTITHTAKFETYDIVIREVHRGNNTPKYYLHITGSLHKNSHNGANFERFSLTDAANEINKLCGVLQIDKRGARVVNLEFGVNIRVDFAPHTFLQDHLIIYKSTPFNQYAPDKRNRRLGYECILAQYRVKCYDKGLQFDLEYNLMRFELRFKKMQKLNQCGIHFLSDLTNPEIIKNLRELLLGAWRDVLLFEPMETQGATLTQTQRDLIRAGSNPNYWAGLHRAEKRKFYHYRAVLRDLLEKYGNGTHLRILSEIAHEWDALANNRYLYEFTIKVKGKNLQCATTPGARYCHSCGREITHQQPGSRFCSPKYVGQVEAHRCRNADSNKRNNLKRKLAKIYSRGVLFEVEPYLQVSAN